MTKQIHALVEQLNKASDAYYNSGYPIMSDIEFDNLLEELKNLEKHTGIILSNSPTRKAGAEIKYGLTKITHDIPMLSLDKCHSTQELIDFAGNNDCYLSVKCDGLSTRLIYENGELISAATRGNGIVGQDVLFHAKEYINIPLTIPYKNELIIDGESVIFENDLILINEELPQDKKFANCRNLASGTLSNLDANVTKSRHMRFIAWRVIKGFDGDSNWFKLVEAKKNGFTIAPALTYTNNSSDKDNLLDMLYHLREQANSIGLPLDGIVMAKDSIALSESLGRTEKFFRHSIAYKFKDETYETELLDIEWTVGRTGTITPTAVFEPVEIDGTLIERASVHNVSVLTQLDLHIGDKLEIIKANQIIPQVHKNISAEGRIYTKYIIIPAICPVCGFATTIKNTNNSKALMCENPNCVAKKLANFTHFVSRNCMNIAGLSEATLSTFISEGYLRTFKDIYHLHEHRNKLIRLDGFGPKSIDKLLASIEKSREVKLENFIAALGIPNIGLSAAKTISKYFDNHNEWYYMGVSQPFRYTLLDDFGDTMMHSIHNFAAENRDLIADLMDEMNFIVPEKIEVKENPFTGKNMCVTGKLHHFTRNSINEKITSLGAKAVGSVSKNTDYLITNEASGSSKYKKAIDLNIPIITEDEFIKMTME